MEDPNQTSAVLDRPFMPNLLELMVTTEAFINGTDAEELPGCPLKAEVDGHIKGSRSHFVVEQSHPLRKTTIAPTTDVDSVYEHHMHTGNGVLVTVVKSGLSTTAVEHRLLQELRRQHKDAAIFFAGQLDKEAITSQLFYIENVPIATLQRMSFPIDLTRSESQQSYSRRKFDGQQRTPGNQPRYFIKDVTPAPEGLVLKHGQHAGNHFRIKVVIPMFSETGQTLCGEDLNAYVLAKVKSMHVHASRLSGAGDTDLPDFVQGSYGEVRMFNMYGEQRASRGGNLHIKGRILIEHGAEEGIKMFLTMLSPREGRQLTQLKQEMLLLWDEAAAKAKAEGKSFLSQKRIIEQMLDLIGRKEVRNLMLHEESDLLNAMLHNQTWEAVCRSRYQKIQFWISSYMSYPYNHVLANFIAGVTPVPEGLSAIPLFFGDEETLAFYRQYFPEAVPEHFDPLITRLFLSKRNGGRGPIRDIVTTVRNLSWMVREREVEFSFGLGSGVFATALLSHIFNLKVGDPDSPMSVSQFDRRG